MAFEDLVEVRSRGLVAFVVRDCAAHRKRPRFDDWVEDTSRRAGSRRRKTLAGLIPEIQMLQPYLPWFER
jgi:hypothetical protein